MALPDDNPHADELTGVFSLRGEALPFVRLRRLFDAGGELGGRQQVVVVHHSGNRMGLVVDALNGESQTVIKPLGRLFQRLPGIADSTILGNGRVALVVDVPELVEGFRSSAGWELQHGNGPGTTAAQGVAVGRD